jgi:hypothetical protein
MRPAFKKSTVRAEPRIINGSSAATSDNPSPIVNASGERGDLLVRGFWENGMDAIVATTNSHYQKKSKSLLRLREDASNEFRYFNERVNFTLVQEIKLMSLWKNSILKLKMISMICFVIITLRLIIMVV